MTFRGLFIGIDHHASQEINWLGCARRDAVALYSLFTDTLGGESTLLIDEEATLNSIGKQFEQLAKCETDDIVVVAFSGHGSDTHELVTYDADPNDLAGSCIPLDTLMAWFSRIPARRLVCILDCCFSGGMGAKVFRSPLTSRSILFPSTEDLLKQLSGDGRLIFTASSATEEAWENQRHGHGLLTFYLLEALQGAEEVRQDGKIDIYSLLRYVTQRVTDAAAQIGKAQHPAMRGTIDGALTWPVFRHGPLFRAAFPERSCSPVTEDIQSLIGYGFPVQILNAWSGSIPSLNALQIDAINNFHVLDGDHLIVSAPTSSGKTMIGELAALKGVMERRRAIFLFPLKALVNDKHRQFNSVYGPFGLRTIQATGDSTDDVPALIRGQYDICLMTYEKFTALVLAFPHILEQVGTIVVDEVQMIADKSRGMNLEFILTFLRMKRRQGIEPQFIALSAVIGSTNGLEHWLGARLLSRTERPVPLHEGVIRGDGSFLYIESESGSEKVIDSYVQRELRKGSDQDWIVPLVRMLVAEGKQVIVFREKKGEARGTANYLAEALGLPPAGEAIDALPTGDPSLISNMLKKCLAGGVALHTADLDRDERSVVEEHFRKPNSAIRVIAATTTLAMGVNTPAEAVIIAGLEHPSIPDTQPEPYSVAEYKNIVGRAGRLGYTERGTSYLLALTPKDEHNLWTRYVLGTPEDLCSRFLDDKTDPRSLIVRVLVAAKRSTNQGLVGLTSEGIVDFLEGSFGAFQEAQATHTWKWDRTQLVNALNNLEAHELVERGEAGIYRLTELGWLAGQGGIEVESITRLVDVLRPLNTSQINGPTLITAAQLTAELDQTLFPVNGKGARKEMQTWMFELERQGIPQYVLGKLQGFMGDQYQVASRFKKAAACLLWITDKSLAEMEEILTKHGGKWNGVAGPVRNVSSRTHDLLNTVVRVAEILHTDLDLMEESARLFTRLEVGVPASIIDLATRTGSRLSRSDYQSLMQAGLSNIGSLSTASDKSLLTCLKGDKQKLSYVRKAIEDYSEQPNNESFAIPLLPKYES
jgi:helicase